METSQNNPYESESSSYMNATEVAMPQYKPLEVTMLQWTIKVHHQWEGYASNKSSSQKSTINDRMCPNAEYRVEQLYLQ